MFKHLNMIFLLCILTTAGFDIKGTLGIGQPELSINPIEQFENEDTGSSFTCDITNINCDNSPGNIYIQKNFNDTWIDAIRVYKNETYDTIILPDGHTMDERIRVIYDGGDGGFGETFRVVIKNVTLGDSGLWRCTVIGCDRGLLSSPSENFLVVTKLRKDGVMITQPERIVLGYPMEYKCIYERVNPEFDVIWNVHGHNYTTGTSFNEYDGLSYTIQNSINITFCENKNTTVTCTLSKTTGLRWSVVNTVANLLIFAPAIIEQSHISNQNPSVTEVVIMECIATGTDRIIQWTKNGTAIPESLFHIDTYKVQGRYKCGETYATKSTLTWLSVPREKCKELMKSDGEYRCEVTAANDTSYTSQAFPISTKYAPIITGDRFMIIESTIGTTIKLECVVECARPSILTYSWSPANGRSGLAEGKSFLSITVQEDDFLTTFVCTVNNSVGESSTRFRIIQIGTQSGTAATDAPISQSVFNLGTIIAIGLGVGLFICLTSFVGFIFYHFIKREQTRNKTPRNAQSDNDETDIDSTYANIKEPEQHTDSGTQQRIEVTHGQAESPYANIKGPEQHTDSGTQQGIEVTHGQAEVPARSSYQNVTRYQNLLPRSDR